MFHDVATPPSRTSNHSNKVPIIEERTIQAEEKKDSFSIFFILLVVLLATLIVHALLVTEIRYMPEALAIVLLGALIGFVLSYSRWDWREVESFNPNFFFLVLLPPIIFESGYTVGDLFYLQGHLNSFRLTKETSLRTSFPYLLSPSLGRSLLPSS